MALITIQIIKLPSFRAPRSLQPFTTEIAAHGQGPSVCVEIGPGPTRFVLAHSQLDRGDAYSPERVFQAGIDGTAQWRHDREALGRLGFTQAWVDDYRYNLDQLTTLSDEQKRRAHAFALNGAFTDGLEKEATALVRGAVFLAQAKKVRHLFQIDSTDWTSQKGLGNAILEVISKVVDPRVLPTLKEIGVDEVVVQRLGEIRGELSRRYIARKDEEVDALETPEQLRAGKAVALSDLIMLSNAARAILPDDQWAERYQLGKLLAEAPRAPAPTPQPTPTPTPPVLGPAPATPGPGVAPTLLAPPAGTVTTAMPSALPQLPAGTVLTIPSAAGLVTMAVQPDGTLLPVPAGPVAKPTRRGRGSTKTAAAPPPGRTRRR